MLVEMLDESPEAFRSTCGGDAECMLWFSQGYGLGMGLDNVTALAEVLGCDFAELCALPNNACDALEAALDPAKAGIEAFCAVANDVLASDVASFETAVSLCQHNTNCTDWMYDDAIGAAVQLIDLLNCSYPCASESCGLLEAPQDDTPASQRAALCNFLFFDTSVRVPLPPHPPACVQSGPLAYDTWMHQCPILHG